MSGPLLDVNRSFKEALQRMGSITNSMKLPVSISWDLWRSELPSMLDAAERHLSVPE